MNMKNRIRELRTNAHYTQLQLQMAFNIDQADISKIESEQRELSIEICKQAALFFHTSMDYLVYLTDLPQPHERNNQPFSPENLEKRAKEVAFLRAKKYTQKDLEQLIHMDQSNCSKVENGSRHYTLPQCKKLAFHLNTSIDYICYLTDNPASYPFSDSFLG